MRLRDRVVLVTGASRGIGRAAALACARAGADVVVAARTEVATSPLKGTIHEVAREVEAVGRRALAVKLDVRDDAACEAAVAATIERFGRLDALVHNAGALWWADALETPAKKLDLVLDTNVRAAFVLARAAIPHMIRARYGHLVMMSPPVDAAAVAHHAAYAIAKIGMTLLAGALAEELREHGVAAHALWPATAIETPAMLATGALERKMMRTPAIVGDALVALLARDPKDRPGLAWLDEAVLREDGVTDFAGYRAVPDVEPPRLAFSGLPIDGGEEAR